MSDDFHNQPDPVADFYQRLFHYTPRLWATQVLIALNLGVFALMVINGINFTEPLTSDLIKWGANYGPLTTQGEWWRWFTCIFVHAGVLHVGMNMYSLWSIGRFVERLLGQTGFFVTYLIAGLAGSLASTTWSPQSTSVGASGAVFGIFSVIFGYVLRNRRTIPRVISQKLLRSGGVVLAINLAIGFNVPSIDMAAHIGGLVAGFLIGLLISAPLTDEAHVRRPLRNALAALIGLAALGGYASTLSPVTDLQVAWNQVDASNEKISTLVSTSSEQYDAGKISAAEFAGILHKQVIPGLEASRKTLLGFKLRNEMDHVRQLQSAVILAYREELELRADALSDLKNTAIENKLKTKHAERIKRTAELNAFMAQLNAK